MGLIASLFLSNIFTLIVSIGVIPFLIKILSVPVKFMIPIIVTVCVVGSYSSSYSMYGVIVMFLSGVLVYPYKERIPNSAHAAFLCIGKAFGVQYA